jgi:hypothetical protein
MEGSEEEAVAAAMNSRVAPALQAREPGGARSNKWV